MKISRKILIRIIFVIVSLFAGNDVIHLILPQSMENKFMLKDIKTGNDNSFFSDSSSEEESSLFIHDLASKWIITGGQNVTAKVTILPDELSFAIWLPPENS